MNITRFRNNSAVRYGLLTLICGVVIVALLGGSLLYSGSGHNDATTPCNGSPAHTYTMAFGNTAVVPDKVTAQRCDELKVVNQGMDPLIAAMGPHEHHIHYPGFTETVLQHGQTYSFRLSKAGTFPVHDHDNDNLRATLVVYEK